jgi:archaellum biogenesis protein FlaJ (TadC family)
MSRVYSKSEILTDSLVSLAIVFLNRWAATCAYGVHELSRFYYFIFMLYCSTFKAVLITYFTCMHE